MDVVFLVLDAREGVTKQDKILADHALQEGKALEFEQVKEDVEEMKQGMSDIKSLLQQLVDKNG